MKYIVFDPSHVPELGFRRFFCLNQNARLKRSEKMCGLVTQSTCRHKDSRFDVTGEGRNPCNVERYHL